MRTSPRPRWPPKSGYVTPNVNVVYGFGFADLKQEPHILAAPDSVGRYYMIEVVDMWTNAFAYPLAANWFSEEWLARSAGEKVAFGVLCELLMENADDGTVDEVCRFCVDVSFPYPCPAWHQEHRR